jgi:hypothetical protein
MHNRYYSVVTNDYLASGGNGYSIMGKAKTLVATGPVLTQVVNEYVQAKSPVRMEYRHQYDVNYLCPIPVRNMMNIILCAQILAWHSSRYLF